MAAIQATLDKLAAMRKQIDDMGLPATIVRATITFVFVGAYLYMQWNSPKEGTVPAALVSVAGIVTGYYLTSDASSAMKAFLSVLYSAAFAAFMYKNQWVPDSVNSQVMTVVGIYFGRRITAAIAAPAKPIPPSVP